MGLQAVRDPRADAGAGSHFDKGIPTVGLLAQAIVAKDKDYVPLYRQEATFERAGLALPASTLAHWVGACGVQLQLLVVALKEELLAQPELHADATPVATLKPGNGKMHRAYDGLPAADNASEQQKLERISPDRLRPCRGAFAITRATGLWQVSLKLL